MLKCEKCLSCNGYGMQLNIAGEIVVCNECKGNCVVPIRDEKGRFISENRSLIIGPST